jgi:hypothetical protein
VRWVQGVEPIPEFFSGGRRTFEAGLTGFWAHAGRRKRRDVCNERPQGGGAGKVGEPRWLERLPEEGSGKYVCRARKGLLIMVEGSIDMARLWVPLARHRATRRRPSGFHHSSAPRGPSCESRYAAQLIANAKKSFRIAPGSGLRIPSQLTSSIYASLRLSRICGTIFAALRFWRIAPRDGGRAREEETTFGRCSGCAVYSNFQK